MREHFELMPYLVWMFSGGMYLIGLASFYGWLRKEAQGLFVARTRRLLMFGAGALLSGYWSKAVASR